MKQEVKIWKNLYIPVLSISAELDKYQTSHKTTFFRPRTPCSMLMFLMVVLTENLLKFDMPRLVVEPPPPPPPPKHLFKVH